VHRAESWSGDSARLKPARTSFDPTSAHEGIQRVVFNSSTCASGAQSAGATPAPLTVTRGSKRTRLTVHESSTGALPVRHPRLLVRPEAGGAVLTRTGSVRLRARRPTCLVTRLVSRAGCRPVESGFDSPTRRRGSERRAQRSLQASGAGFDSWPIRQGLVREVRSAAPQAAPAGATPAGSTKCACECERKIAAVGWPSKPCSAGANPAARSDEPEIQRSALIATQRGAVRLRAGSPFSPFGRTPTRPSEGRGPRSTRGGETRRCVRLVTTALSHSAHGEFDPLTSDEDRGKVAGTTGGTTSRPRVVRFHCLGPGRSGGIHWRA